MIIYVFHELISRYPRVSGRYRGESEIYLFFPVGLQEPAVIAVDRLHRFRWSGGGGGSGKKSSSGPRSEKAERLRELTEKLKGPAPVPPPRRPSRVQASSPPPGGYQPSSQNYPQVKNSERHSDVRAWRVLLRANDIFRTTNFFFLHSLVCLLGILYTCVVRKKKNVYLSLSL